MIPLKLSYTIIADKKLRFCMIDESKKLYITNDMRKSGWQPLFLGCDVLTGMTECTKNRSRIHARFAKLGLATKLEFTDCRIDGLPKGDEAYFYSVLGLFKVAFDIYPVKVQRSCVQNLIDIWMSACSSDELLQLDLTYQIAFDDVEITHVSGVGMSVSAGTGTYPHTNISTVSSTSVKDIVGCDLTTESSHQTSRQTDSAAVSDSENLTSSCATFRLCTQGTQTYDFSEQMTQQEQEIFSDYVCRMCRVRTKMIDREKADLQTMGWVTEVHKPSAFVPGSRTAARGVLESSSQRIGREEATDLALLEKPGDVVNRTLISTDLSFHHLTSLLGNIDKGDASQHNDREIQSEILQQDNFDGSVEKFSETDEKSVVKSNAAAFGLKSAHLTSPSLLTEEMEVDRLIIVFPEDMYSTYEQKCQQVGSSQLFCQPSGLLSLAAEDGTAGVLEADSIHKEITACSEEYPAEPPGSSHAVPLVSCILRWIEEANNTRMLLHSDSKAQQVGQDGHITMSMANFHKPERPSSENSGMCLMQTSQLEFVLLVLDFLARSLECVKSPTSLSALSELLLLLLSAVENNLDHCPEFDQWPTTSSVKFSALLVFGKWLGEEFRRFEPAISQRVTDFKRKHINNIDELPPAAKVIEELFPPSMVLLASTWIGLTDLQMVEVAEMDHSYEDQSKTESASPRHNRNLYPVIQLILELLNNSLVSGMAHVVYCKLRHAA